MGENPKYPSNEFFNLDVGEEVGDGRESIRNDRRLDRGAKDLESHWDAETWEGRTFGGLEMI